MKDQPISSLMQAQTATVSMDLSAKDVESFLASHQLSWAPVVGDAGEIIGVISDADLLRRHAQGRDLETKKAWQISTFRPICVDLATTVGAVARIMVDKRIHHVVVTEGGAICGVVSSLDFVRIFA
jgi:signal-transduction protein with cAMP-binding, CBS, and nucleotidyltransferase domain